MSNASIDRSALQRSLVGAAQTRVIITLLSAVVCLLTLAIIHSLIQLPAFIMPMAFFGIPMAVSWVAT